MKLSWLSWAILPVVAGCAGTSPNLSTPQMQTPQLGNGFGNRSTANAPGSAAEASLPALEPVKTPDSTFLADPYLQLGNHPGLGKTDSLAVLWHALPDDKATWSVEVRPSTGGVWKPAEKPSRKTVTVKDVPPFEILSANLSGLKPGALFDYRVVKSGTPVFSARARARRGSKEAQRVVVVGDHASGTPESRKVAFQIGQAKPDLIVDTGDIVYDRGRVSEYRDRFFPVYNADAPDADKGASLTRSTLWAGVPGNHDIASADLDKYPDGKAYFYLWNQPLNGPSGLGKSISPISGAEANQKAFLSAAGLAYPKASTYSFDAGSAHWTVLDSNSYTNWTDPTLAQWLEKDLKSSKATWKFVAFHHPPFHSSSEHEDDQWMRALCPIFEKYKVAIVWSGHVHNYQRTFPLKFAPTKPRDAKGIVDGTFAFDKEYDGQTKTKPTAPIYVVTGGGGAKLYSVDLDDKPAKWKPFTKKYVGSANSFTAMDIDGKKLTIQQISLDGKELDRFTVTQ
jgi:3',5'-cyclic AMP phosphodiesterase CpdA